MLDRSTTSPEPRVEPNPTQKLSSETTLAHQKPPRPELPAQSTPCKKNLSLGSKPTEELLLLLRPSENLGHAVCAKPTLPGSCFFVKHLSCPSPGESFAGDHPGKPWRNLGILAQDRWRGPQIVGWFSEDERVAVCSYF